MKHLVVHLVAVSLPVIVLLSCTAEYDLNPQTGETDSLFLSSFCLLPEHNRGLTRKYDAEFNGDIITLFCSELASSDSIVPSFAGRYSDIRVGG